MNIHAIRVKQADRNKDNEMFRDKIHRSHNAYSVVAEGSLRLEPRLGLVS